MRKNKIRILHVAQAAGGSLVGEEGIVDVVIAVVDEVCLEGGGLEVAGVHGHESEVDVEHIGPTALEWTGAEGDGLVVLVVVEGMGVGVGLLCAESVVGRARPLGCQIGDGGLGLLTGNVVVVRIDDHALANEDRNLETVFVANEGGLIVGKTGYDAAAYLVEKSHFVSYFHGMGGVGPGLWLADFLQI